MADPTSDPLGEIVSLLRPRAGFAKVASGAGRWRVTRELDGEPFYCVVLDGAARMTVDGHPAVQLQAGDFVLVPSLFHFAMESMEMEGAGKEGTAREGLTVLDPSLATPLPGEIRHGDPEGSVNARLLVGHFHFGSPDARLLVQLLPRLLHLRGAERLSALVRLLTDETRAARPAREMILARLLDVILLEALRAAPDETAPGETPPSGILRGLADERLAASLRCLHGDPAQDWTIESLAREASLSRSAFYKRFRAALGMPPMEYLTAWRMALAKTYLDQRDLGMEEIAGRIGYGSASAFSTAFTRFVGVPPSRYGAPREGAAA
ncbi:AraC family transcriptional regulator [Rhizobium sp. AAP43]|uniref:AraC family transcriptional regulator n=1 Tax=Rhizobium sp. AAP43 TaxID=1523420 RepID=UPI0006B8F56A|nr:AraC family transcriptional regulator [Rhizobium sp. AAP43]KPF46829.1 AraC family transcriptional regulator [Rhizobium sp. AAP43]